MSVDLDTTKSRLERVLGQSIVEILNAVYRGPMKGAFWIGGAIILSTFFVRFSALPFIREMGTSEFIVGLVCGVTLILAAMLFVFAIFFMLLKKISFTS